MELAVADVEAPDEDELFRPPSPLGIVVRVEADADEVRLVVGEQAEREDERQARER